MRRSKKLMGTVVSLDIPSCVDEAVFARVFAELVRIDQDLSPYKNGSQVSLFRDGKLSKDELGEELKSIIKTSRAVEDKTNGYFSLWAGGHFDPSGYVKGWAIDLASRVVQKQGYKTFCLGIGGDINARSDGNKTWRLGIQDPHSQKNVVGVLAGQNLALATSGNYERGDHIYNPKTGKKARGLDSLSVIGPDIIWADVLATAGFAMGTEALAFMGTQAGYEALAVMPNGQIRVTTGMERLLESSHSLGNSQS